MDACERLNAPVRPTPDFCMAVVNHLADQGVLMKLHDEGSVLGAMMLRVLSWTPFMRDDSFTTPFVFRAFAVQAAKALLEDRAVWRGSEEEDPLGVVRDQKIRLVRLAELKRVLGERDLPPDWITAVVREIHRLPKVMFVEVNHEEVLCHGDGVITANKDVVKAQLIQVSSIRCINQALRDLNRRHSRARENLDTYVKTRNEKMVILQLKQVKMIEAESNKLECLLSRITDVVHRASSELDLLHSTCENAINVLKKTVNASALETFHELLDEADNLQGDSENLAMALYSHLEQSPVCDSQAIEREVKYLMERPPHLKLALCSHEPTVQKESLPSVFQFGGRQREKRVDLQTESKVDERPSKPRQLMRPCRPPLKQRSAKEDH
ncbi:MAG: uncharacterized protein KVP18_000621 [Porospora cf. gigantea A]|uniref:uncharacterized protein n=1 Tax=Porospora cf. gigantea A TaxID=2853593 RepID=UPI00355A1B93|nr:MAG: hypothetical protein KVP18_000621 [Porospora cf. gigantea A]